MRPPSKRVLARITEFTKGGEVGERVEVVGNVVEKHFSIVGCDESEKFEFERSFKEFRGYGKKNLYFLMETLFKK